MVNHRQKKKKARSVLFRETLADLLRKKQKPEEVFRIFLWYAFRILVMELLEAEVKEHLQAERYERSVARRGRRNGYRKRTIQTAEGPIEVDVPRIRESDEPFRSMILDLLPARSGALVRWLLEGYARGLSTRDLEAILADDTGQPVLSRSAISAITERLWAEYEAFLSSDLSGYELEYLWLDGVYESVRPYVRGQEAVFCAWGMCRDGTMVLLGLSLGVKESRDAWTEFLYDLIRRGLREPVLVVTDGSPVRR